MSGLPIMQLMLKMPCQVVASLQKNNLNVYEYLVIYYTNRVGTRANALVIITYVHQGS